MESLEITNLGSPAANNVATSVELLLNNTFKKGNNKAMEKNEKTTEKTLKTIFQMA